ncbi:NUDIX domain-containing protein [Gordonia sp. NPDC003585]|uniref:NUDIX hydrolase n=1 Tax=unclassified Gordonia (in: high G+C Gram-positive bacteria) TaxID=2657482 RepID=UPI0033AD7C12
MSRESLHTSAVEALTAWNAPDVEQDALRHAYLAFLASAPDACLRRCVAGHLTASAVVFDATLDHVLLTLHPRVGKWIQLGGHCEETDDRLADAALREAREESGIADLALSGGIVTLHTHPISCSLGVPTRHLDVRYRAVAPPTHDGSLPDIECSDESVDLRWWPVAALPETARTGDMWTLITRGRARRVA